MSMTHSITKAVSLTLKSSPVTFLLAVVPVGLMAGHLGWSSTLVFWINFVGIIPLASVLAFATEELAEHVGQTLGGLLNATFGNAVELIVSIIALKQNQVRIVQASMLGSILSNSLLVLGCCFVAGGYNRLQQTFNQTAAQTMSSLMALATAGLMIPAAFHASLPTPKVAVEKLMGALDFPVPGTSDDQVLALSRGTSLILLLVYILFLVFQLGTHKSIFEAQTIELDNTLEGTTQESVALPLDHSNQVDESEKHLSLVGSLVVLFLTTIVVSFAADFLVGSIDDLVALSGLSKTFIGLIVIPIVGNAAEHVTAVVVAVKDKMDLAIGVAIGSSLQIALFVTPFMVLMGWAIDVPMSLYFSTFETAVLFLSVFITNIVILDGESNWLEGAMLLCTYLIIALAFFFYPDNAL